MPTKMTVVTPTKNFAVQVEGKQAALNICASLQVNSGILVDSLWVPIGKVEGVQFEEIPEAKPETEEEGE
jgi:hypothetical protein